MGNNSSLPGDWQQGEHHSGLSWNLSQGPVSNLYQWVGGGNIVLGHEVCNDMKLSYHLICSRAGPKGPEGMG